jgi:Zn-dependent protease with chaperone function
VKFEPKELPETQDINRAPTTRGFILRSGALLAAVLLGGYLLIGWLGEAIAVRVPRSFEKKLSFLGAAYLVPAEGRDADQALAEKVFAKLRAGAQLPDLDYRVVVIDMEAPNVLAIPGGGIAVTTGLMDAVKSEEELAMVLGHELGHFIQRDHMRGLGRNLLFAVVVGFIFGESGFSQVVSLGVDLGERSHSRKQESGADRIGLDMLVKAYGHAGGATDFFKSLQELHGDSRFLRYISTHPHSGDRVARIEELIDAGGYPRKNPLPLREPAGAKPPPAAAETEN